MKRRVIFAIEALLLAGLLIGPTMAVVAKDLTAAEKRMKIDNITKDNIARLKEKSVDAKTLYDKAYGYAVFTDTKVAFGLSGGGGIGEAVAKNSSNKTYMKMATGGVGLGLGVQKSEVIFLFETKEVFDNFVQKGWQAGAGANAAVGEAGANKAVGFKNGMAIYQFTKKGLLVAADVSGSKYWKDDELN